jgi:hypothetical protein
MAMRPATRYLRPATRYPMSIYSIRILIWSKTRTHRYVNGAKPSSIGYVGTGTV